MPIECFDAFSLNRRQHGLCVWITVFVDRTYKSNALFFNQITNGFCWIFHCITLFSMVKKIQSDFLLNLSNCLFCLVVSVVILLLSLHVSRSHIFALFSPCSSILNLSVFIHYTMRHKSKDRPTKKIAEKRILLYFASHSGRNISKLTECLSVYFFASDVKGHSHLFIKSTMPSRKIAPTQNQTSLLTLLNAPA